jgi:hypothetical protein
VRISRAVVLTPLLLTPLLLPACGHGDAGPTAASTTAVAISAVPETVVLMTTVPYTTVPQTSGAATTAPATTEPATTEPEPELEIPPGVLVAVPTQNREDPAKSQFQVQIHNGTRDRFDVVGVQFSWTGYSTPMTTRDSIIVGGQVIDFPVPFPGAVCVGDGGIDEMPSIDDARVLLELEGGALVEMPVIDQWHLARKLYLEDCERQMIESQVAIEWVDLHEEGFDGRPVTAGALRLTRRAGAGEITILSVSNTIPYEFVAVDGKVGEPVAALAEGADVASVPVRFEESRCDPHALAEVKQPTKFISQVDLGDGVIRPYIVYPERSYWTEMRLTADKACVILGEVEFVGEG